MYVHYLDLALVIELRAAPHLVHSKTRLAHAFRVEVTIALVQDNKFNNNGNEDQYTGD